MFWSLKCTFRYGFARNGQFCMYFSYIGQVFGLRYLGGLSGIGFIVSAMVSLLQVLFCLSTTVLVHRTLTKAWLCVCEQSPLVWLVQHKFHGNFAYGNIGLMVVIAAMLPYSAYLFWVNRIEKQRLARKQLGADHDSALHVSV